MIKINAKDELSLYNLEGKWNDYIGVQKEVLRVLREKKWFDSNEVINEESNLHIKVTAKGIRETLGNEILIDGDLVGVRISVKKKVGSKHFWIHNIDEYKKL